MAITHVRKIPNQGEQTAAALEANLSNLENKLDAILAALEASEASEVEQPKALNPGKVNSSGKTPADKGPAEDDANKGKSA
ncbi:hypothetical protein G7Z17_g12107 [Cylindrodendrum hubeiense]|uniref:Uncharacterized protein n=1 Tax=Cylindrodendrum hubeiense TaxID=595255 RepID=A0A9P5LAN4_9HYPO|nr:hypothetical protein G7Z17_g12107 [Cylindrodendrum hubeiense]